MPSVTPKLRDALTLIVVLAIFIVATYLIVMAGGAEMTRVPNPNYLATPMSRPGG